MNFLKELEKRKLKATEVWNEDGEFYFNSKDIKELWRVFWEKRRKELKAEIKHNKKHEKFVMNNYIENPMKQKTFFAYGGRIEVLQEQLSWIEKQLKEVKKE